VVAEETTNAVLAARNHAFERLFTIVLATLLLGSLAVTLYATWLTSRIRRLRNDADAAIDVQGRLRGELAGSTAKDEIGDLARGITAVLTRLSDYASYQEKMAGRLSHELRTPLAVVRSSLDNLRQTAVPDEARVYVERAHQYLAGHRRGFADDQSFAVEIRQRDLVPRRPVMVA
jgi:two-component system sensor histidine kinase ChvG